MKKRCFVTKHLTPALITIDGSLLLQINGPHCISDPPSPNYLPPTPPSGILSDCLSIPPLSPRAICPPLTSTHYFRSSHHSTHVLHSHSCHLSRISLTFHYITPVFNRLIPSTSLCLVLLSPHATYQYFAQIIDHNHINGHGSFRCRNMLCC